MQKTRSCTRPVRLVPANSSGALQPKPQWPIALCKATLHDVEVQLRHAKQRADAICVQLQDLDLELRLLDWVSRCAEFGDSSSLAEIMQLQRDKIELFPSLE